MQQCDVHYVSYPLLTQQATMHIWVPCDWALTVANNRRRISEVPTLVLEQDERRVRGYRATFWLLQWFDFVLCFRRIDIALPNGNG